MLVSGWIVLHGALTDGVSHGRFGNLNRITSVPGAMVEAVRTTGCNHRRLEDRKRLTCIAVTNPGQVRHGILINLDFKMPKTALSILERAIDQLLDFQI